MFNKPYFKIGTTYTFARNKHSMVSYLSRISMAGLILSVAILIVVKSVMNGFDYELRTRILGVVPQAIVEGDMSDRGWAHYRDQLNGYSFVKGAAPFIQVDAMARHGNRALPMMLKGVSIEHEPKVSRIEEYIDSSLSELLDSDDSAMNALVGRQLAVKMGLTIGQSFVALVPSENRGADMLVLRYVGALDTATQLDQLLVVTDIDALQRRLPSAHVRSVQLSFDDIFMARSYLYHLQVRLPSGFYGRTWQSTHGNLYQAVQTSRSLINLLLSFIIFIAAFNVISTLVLIVLDKRQDIAILRTMGASKRGILATYLVQGASIGAIGAGVGAVLGSLLALFLAPMVAYLEQLFDFKLLDSAIYPVSFVPIDWRWLDVLEVSALAVFASLIAAVYPAYRASSTDAATNLRHD